MSLCIGGNVITASKNVKNLGVTIDPLLDMHEHVNMVCKSVAFHLYNVWRIRKYIDKPTAEKVVHALATSKLDYCNALLCGCHKYSLDKLQRMQNMAAKIIAQQPKFSHVSPILKELHWLPISARVEYKIAHVLFKSVSCTAPAYLSDMFQEYVPSVTLRSATKCLLNVPNYRLKTFGGRAISVFGANFWNQLPTMLRHVESLEDFKEKLKTYLFQVHFNNA